MPTRGFSVSVSWAVDSETARAGAVLQWDSQRVSPITEHWVEEVISVSCRLDNRILHAG